MGIAERIYAVVKELPVPKAAEVLDYAERKRSKPTPETARRQAFAILDKHARKFKAEPLNRADLYDRTGLR
jgi:hypothetical protein